jgi:putative endopeptidase
MAIGLGAAILGGAGISAAGSLLGGLFGGKKPKAIDGFTGDQRFFLGFSQVWRQKYREPALLQQLVTDPHTPGHFRPYVVRNIDAWYKAFNVKQGEKMYLSPEERIKLW